MHINPWLLLFLVQGHKVTSQDPASNSSNYFLNLAEDTQNSEMNESWFLLELCGNSTVIIQNRESFELTIIENVADLTQSRMEDISLNSVTFGPDILINMTSARQLCLNALTSLANHNDTLLDINGNNFTLFYLLTSHQILSSKAFTSQLSSQGKDILTYLCFAGAITFILSSFLLVVVCRCIRLQVRAEDKKRDQCLNSYLPFPQISYSRELMINYNVANNISNWKDNDFNDNLTPFTNEDFMPRYLKREFLRECSSDLEYGEPPPLEHVERRYNFKNLSTFSDIDEPPPLEIVKPNYNESISSLFIDMDEQQRHNLSPLTNSSLDHRRRTCPVLMFSNHISSSDKKSSSTPHLNISSPGCIQSIASVPGSGLSAKSLHSPTHSLTAPPPPPTHLLGSSHSSNSCNYSGSSHPPNSSYFPGSSHSPNLSDLPGSSIPPNSSDLPGSSISPNSFDHPGSSNSHSSSNLPGSSDSPNSSHLPRSSHSPNSSHLLGSSPSPNTCNRPRLSHSPNSSHPARSSHSPNSFHQQISSHSFNSSKSSPNSVSAPLPSQEQINKHVSHLFENLKLKVTVDQNENVSIDHVTST